MSGIVLQTKALKIVNSGGGCKTTTKKISRGRYTTTIGDHTKGTDYIVFDCPKCHKRNKQSMYLAKGNAGDSVSFICNGCRQESEVSRPTKILLDQNAPVQGMGLVNPEGQPIRSQ